MKSSAQSEIEHLNARVRQLERELHQCRHEPSNPGSVAITDDIHVLSEQRLRLVLEAGSMGTWEWIISTGRVIWSPSLEAIHGLKAGAFPSTFEAVIAEMHPDDCARVKSVIQETLERRGDYHIEYRIVRADGSVRWLEARGRLLCDASGAPERMIGVCSDITDRRQQEEYLRQSQKMESLGILAGGIAHDFNNLLVGIMGNASLAMETLPQGNSIRGLLEEVNKASQRAAALTRQLLAYAGKARFLTELVSPADLIRETTALVRHATPQKVSFDLHLEEDLPPIEAEASQIHQVIFNLVVNAVEAIGQQSGCVSITTELEALTSEEMSALNLRLRPGPYMAITVRDTGCGMDEATKARIFDPFFTTKFSGRGLGLAAVLGIVKGHHGMLRVVSAPGKGSAFTVLLPPAAGKPASDAVQEEHPPRGEGTILVVDDEAMVRQLAKTALEYYGYHVLDAGDGADAVRVFREQGDRISLVLLDLTMPGMDGDETFDQLHQIRPDVLVVLTTGCAEADAARRFADRKLAGILQKPYTASALARKLGGVLRTPGEQAKPRNFSINERVIREPRAEPV